MNFSPLMGKFESRYSLIAGAFFPTVNALRSVWTSEKFDDINLLRKVTKFTFLCFFTNK